MYTFSLACGSGPWAYVDARLVHLKLVKASLSHIFLYATCSKLHACFNASYAKLNTLELFNLQGMRGSTE